MKTTHHSILFLVLIASSTPFVFAQSEKIIQNDSIYLWVPEKMVQGESYEGLIVLSEATNNSKLALISSSDAKIVQVAKTTLVNPYNNHGIFQITPKDEGIAEIFVSINGELSSKQVQVYSQKSGPQSLQLYLPTNKTKADVMSVYVFALDGNGTPAPVEDNTDIRITSTNGVDISPTVPIKQGEFYAKFLAKIKGDGTIAASSKNLKSDIVNIKKIQDSVDVKLAVAPNIIAQDSFAYYYVWLEKNGKPFNIPVVDVILHSTDPKVVRLTSIPPQYQNDNMISTLMRDGVGKGILYTGKAGHATLVASIARFASASADVVVGPATIGLHDIPDDEDIALQEFETQFGGKNVFVPDTPNSALLWVYPDITSEKAWGVAALYFSNSTETIDITLDEQGSQISSIMERTTLYPITTDGRTVTISSNAGLEHDSVYEMSEHGLKTHAIEFEIIGKSNGQYVVELSGTGIEKTTATVEIRATDDEYHTNIISLPTQIDTPQDLAIISIVDSGGNLVDVKNTFGKNIKMAVSATSARLNTDEITIDSENTGEVKGILTGISTLSTTSKELGLRDKTLYPAGVATSLELLLPKSVHVGEQFPFVIHEMDSFGTPLKKTIAGFSSSLGIKTIDDSYFILENQGVEKITVLSDIGANQQEIQSFSNLMNISVSVNKSLVRVGEDIELQITNAVSDVTYSIISPFPYEQISNNIFKLTPDSEITNAEIIVTASKAGYSSKTDVVTVTSEYVVTVTVDSVATSGEKLRIPYDIEGTNLPTIQTPQSYELKPQQITMTFPQKYSSSSGGYEFQDMLVNGHAQSNNTVSIYTDDNYEIIANYQRQIQIIVNDGQGGGIYPYGASVFVTAPEKQKIFFLIRDVFDHWEGIDKQDSSFEMTVTKDMAITAVYREDHTNLMIMVFVGISVLAAIIVKKANTGYVYKIKNIADGISDKLKKLLTNIPKKKKFD